MARRRISRRYAMPFGTWVIPTCAGVLVVTALVIMSVILAASISNMPQNIFSASVSFDSDQPSVGLLDPDSEIRGVWIASVENIDYPSQPGLDAETLKKELDDIVATVSELGLNAIYFQVRPTSDALYDSALFPVSAYLTGDQSKPVSGGFDPLAYLLDIAHSNNIMVHAWVNPLRVTSGKADEPQHDLEALAVNNPARMFPEWTVPYADGKLYYNAGIPAVRELVAAGVAEIVRKYDVDGIIFDDYFYPYPVSGAKFDDDEEYKLYGNGMSLGDWRRENVNLMIRDCYIAIKTLDVDCKFGIAPFGIWQNDDGKNGGSDTSGLESYNSLYCDPLAWIEGGYIDYIAPQIYWQFSTSAARYDTLVHWWNAQLEGHDDVGLVICHAAYRSAEWATKNEIRNQVEYARSERSYRGSIFYGFSAIRANDMGLKEQIKSLYPESIVYGKTVSNGRDVVVNSPVNGSYMTDATTYLIGASDPAYPLYFNGETISRTKDGYFSLYVDLKHGENKFEFIQNDKTYTHIINRGTYKGTPSEKTYATLDGYKIASYGPTTDFLVGGGTVIDLSVKAPSGSVVTASLGSKVVRLNATVNPPNNGSYMSETYTGQIKVPSSAENGEIVDLGNITYKAIRGDESAEAVGVNVRVIGDDASVTIEVLKDDSPLKLSLDSWYYDDYTPASAGMRAGAVQLEDGWYKLAMGAYIAEEDVKEIDRTVELGSISSAVMENNGSHTVIRIAVSENVPLNGHIADGKFHVTLYNVDSSAQPELIPCDNPLFVDYSQKKHSVKNSYRFSFDLVDINNFYGFVFSYVDGFVVVTLKNPEMLSTSEKPLSGKTIILDAGHGGNDSGARGPSPEYNEDDMNLAIVLAAAPMLEELGAEVILTRSENVTVDIYTRLDLVEEIRPDLLISVHQNSMPYTTDVSKVRGLLSLHFSDAGKLFSSCISKAMSDALNRMERNPAQQRLAMVRNAKFPSALVEVSFITCVEEYDMMLREGMFERAAEGLVDGILGFYKAQEKYVK